MLKKIWTHYFIPQERNNHRATIIKPNFLLFFLILYLLNQSIIKSLIIVKPGILGYSSEITVQKVLDQTNDERVRVGLEPYQYNQILSESAKKKAQDMFFNNYWAHNSPQGKNPWTFFEAVGYKYSVAGENLAKDFYSTDALVKAWMDSPTHKTNIVHSKYKEIGIAVVDGVLGGVKTTLVVQHFGTPLNLAELKSPINETINTSEPIVNIDNPVLAAKSQKLISPLSINKLIGFLIFIVLVSILFIDGYITIKKDIHRLTGSTVGHIGFLIFIFILMLYNQQGGIF